MVVEALRDARVVVTGAGGGIGAALARRFVAEGARVAVNDLDADAARRTAAEIGAAAVPGDASTIVPAARTALGGGIDIFCANAGVGTGGGPEADDTAWELAWDVNVMSHVRAARALLPEWLERGEGRFVSTVSAAGLLTMIGAAPYSVTKHGALAFAEWLSLTYRHRGIHVHAVCPQGVRTAMLRSSGAAGELVLAPNAIEPEDVAQAVVDGIVAERFLILPHPEVAEYYATRAAEPERWLGGMNKLQRGYEQLQVKEARAKEAEAQKDRAREDQAREDGSQDRRPKEDPAREDPAQDAQAREDPVRDAQAQETQAQETQAQETQAQETQAQEGDPA